MVYYNEEDKDKIEKVELLDLYEGRENDLLFNHLPESLSIKERLISITDHLKKFDQIRGEEYLNSSLLILDDIEYLEKTGKELGTIVKFTDKLLGDVPDSDYVCYPQNSKIEQLVIRRKPVFPKNRWYTIQKNLWGFLDKSNRTATILHEVTFGEAFDKFEHVNSVCSRYVNFMINSMEIKSLNEYLKMITFCDFRANLSQYQEIKNGGQNFQWEFLRPSTDYFIQLGYMKKLGVCKARYFLDKYSGVLAFNITKKVKKTYKTLFGTETKEYDAVLFNYTDFDNPDPDFLKDRWGWMVDLLKKGTCN